MRSHRKISRIVGVSIVALGGWSAVSVTASQEGAGDPAREVYEAACAACHGVDGRGAPDSVVGFEMALPDFTDCRFATREPDADWRAVSHLGGPARGFAAMMPAFGEALTSEELQHALDRVRSFCKDSAWPRGELNLPRALVTEKAYPEDETVFTTAIDTEGDTAVTNTLVYERRFGARSQFEVVMPFASRDPGNGDLRNGFGDVAVAMKRAVAHSIERGSIFSVSGELVFPTGSERDGLGKGTAVFEPFVSYGQILPYDTFLQFQGGVELPFDTAKAEREAFWRGVIGASLTQGAFGRTWSPMLEVLGARALEDESDVEWDIVPQVQVTLNKRQHIMANVGVRIPVTDAGQRSTKVLFYLLWDWFDGGFFEGW